MTRGLTTICALLAVAAAGGSSPRPFIFLETSSRRGRPLPFGSPDPSLMAPFSSAFIVPLPTLSHGDPP